MIFENLTPRQKEILNLLCLGFDDFDITKKLFITRSTLRTHLALIFDAYGIEGRNRKIKLILARIHERK